MSANTVPAMSNEGGNRGGIALTSQNKRSGGPDVGQADGAALRAAEFDYKRHYTTPSYPTVGGGDKYPAAEDVVKWEADTDHQKLPYWYNRYDGPPVPYAADTDQKENMRLKAAVRDAKAADGMKRGYIVNDDVSSDEVDYLRQMKDMVELAKFDEYVETLIDPKKPGNMKFLMEVYPDYINRRLQQAHTDYEFALRNQMIDMWGINTFDDLHFKYLVDQGRLVGPHLEDDRPPVDDSYAAGWLSPWNFQQSNRNRNKLYLPYASSRYGMRPKDNTEKENIWSYPRNNRVMGGGGTDQELAYGIYDLNHNVERRNADQTQTGKISRSDKDSRRLALGLPFGTAGGNAGMYSGRDGTNDLGRGVSPTGAAPYAETRIGLRA